MYVSIFTRMMIVSFFSFSTFCHRYSLFYFVPTLPNQSLLTLHYVVIIASVLLAPSLALSFEILRMLYFSVKCIF